MTSEANDVIAHIRNQGATYHRGSWTAQGELNFDFSAYHSGVHFLHFDRLTVEEKEKLTKGGKFDGIIVSPEPVTAVMKASFKVRIGAGVNNVALNEGEVCMNTPGINSDTTCEWIIKALLFSLGGRPIEEIDSLVKSDKLITTFPAYPPLYVNELTGKRIAILGSGNISSEVIQFAHARHMDVSVWSPSLRAEDSFLMRVRHCPTAEAAAAGADFLIVLTTLVENPPARNVGFVNGPILKATRKGAVVINFARPALLDVTALQEVLESGHLSRVIIDGDLFANETGPLAPYKALSKKFGHDNRIVLLPHVGGDTSQTARANGCMQAVDQALGFILRKEVVNWASPSLKLPDGYRVVGPKKAAHVGAVDKASLARLARDAEKRRKMLEEAQKALDLLKKIDHESASATDEALAGDMALLLRHVTTLEADLPLGRRLML